MKILVVHNRYKIRGGEDVSTEAEVALLKANGIEVHTLFINNNIIINKNRPSLAFNAIWSFKYYYEILQKVKKEKYDIVHVQNFFPLFSPSIFYAAKKAGAKTIMSVRNYRLICPNGLLFKNEKICTDCIGKKIPYPSVLKKCYQESHRASAVTATMLSFHNFLNTWKSKIDGFICISNFVEKKLLESNFNPAQLHVKYNVVSTELAPNYTPEEYYVYAGRISTEKGISLLLTTFRTNNKKLIILGDGPMNASVLDACEENKNITFLGKTSLLDTYKKIASAKALIVPSMSHETFGRTIVEAFAHGTPVIGSSLGGITELIQDNYNGILFDPYTKGGLEKAIERFESIENIVYIRKNAYSSYLNRFDPNSNFIQLTAIYKKVMEQQ